MMEQINLVPKRRFKEFQNTDIWEQRSVGDIGNFYFGGGTPRTDEEEYWGGDLPWIQSSDIAENVLYVDKPKKTISDAGLKNSATKLVPENSITIVTRVGVGKLAFMPYKFSTSQDFLSISHLNVDSHFGTYVLYKLLQKEKNAAQGTSIKGITKENLLTMKVMIPNDCDEQGLIGSFFRQLDQLITLHQRKLEKMKALKSAYLSEMFPADGEREPKRRFAGFNQTWEESSLGEIGEFKNGMNFGKEALGHGYPFVNLQDIFGKNVVDDTNLGLAESDEKQRKEYSLQKGDVLFVRSSVKPEGVGEAAIITKKLDNTTFSGFIIRFRLNVKVDMKFSCFVFSTTYIRNQILTSATSSANTNINQETLRKLQIMLPSVEEQEKIGNFFWVMDNIITLHQRKLEKLQNIKKAYLNEMFV